MTDSTDSEEEIGLRNSIFQLCSTKKKKKKNEGNKLDPYVISLQIGNNYKKFELDSGSSHNVVSDAFYVKYFNTADLEEVNTVLADYIGQQI